MAELTDEEVADTEGDGYIGVQRVYRLVEELGTHICRASSARRRKGSTLCHGAGHQWCYRHEVEATAERDPHAKARGFGVLPLSLVDVIGTPTSPGELAALVSSSRSAKLAVIFRVLGN